jgi:cytochrome c oxidase subunit 2
VPFEPHSTQARAIASLFTETLVVCAVVFLLVTALVGVCVLRFRARNDGERARVPDQVLGNRKLEIAWTLAPILVLAGLVSLTISAMSASDPPVDRAPDLTLVAHQWWWEARYASGAVAANEIHLPVGQRVALRLESADVIHDFWVPELGRKMDIIPGRPSTMWIEADTAGTYEGTCAEYCGVQHAWMRILVIAQSPEDFAAWERHQIEKAPAPPDENATRGASLFASMTCVSCHAIGGTGATAAYGPDLTHLAERRTLGAGVLVNTAANLSRWLKNPQAIKDGCHMPNAQLTDAQVESLVAYFETLR